MSEIERRLAAAKSGDATAVTDLFRSVQPLLLCYLRTIAGAAALVGSSDTPAPTSADTDPNLAVTGRLGGAHAAAARRPPREPHDDPRAAPDARPTTPVRPRPTASALAPQAARHPDTDQRLAGGAP